MKLLILTQAVDSSDPVLGFFHRWIEAIARRVESVEVICLREGTHQLPPNVRVHSLGGVGGEVGWGGRVLARIRYVFRFYALVWRLRGTYEAVFVHMNQEYVLLGGWLWRLLGKRIYMWRNHAAGSFATDIAASFCRKIFCTSKHSYTARYPKTVRMPVGVDTEQFVPDARVRRAPRSVLFLGRIAPVKRPEILIDALALLKKEGHSISAAFVGSPLPKDISYYQGLVEKIRTHGLTEQVTVYPGVRHLETPDLYRAYETFVNCSPSGALDKTIFEAAASGCRILTTSRDIAEEVGEEVFFEDAVGLAEKLASLKAESAEEEHRAREALRALAARHSLAALTDRLVPALY